MTSANCVHGRKPNQLIVRAGSENYNRGGVKAKVSKIIAHKKYNESCHDYDLAILKLKGCLDISTSRIVEVPIPQQHISAEDGIVTGWMYDGIDGPLQLKSVKMYGRSKCEQVTGINITKRMFCANLTNTEECVDFPSGSPLVAEGKLIGIKCFGFPCNPSKREPDVFTSVFVLSKFIRKVTKRFA